jgi:DNA-binding CsgD family transcriptional regulator
VPREGLLFGREAELATVVGGAGSLVFVEGHAGVGKTSLLEAARARLRGSGGRILWASGQELEREFGFGVARQLFERSLNDMPDDERGRLLDGAAALGSVALGEDPSRGRGVQFPDSPFPVVHGLYWLTAGLAEREGVVLFVDDAHWADAVSLRFLDYLAARLEEMAVGVVVAARPAQASADEGAGLLSRLRERAGSHLVRLGPLAFEAAAALVSDRLGGALDPRLVAACVEVTGGNAFLLGALADALLADRVQPGPAAVELVSRLGPETVARSVMLRLARLPAAAVPVADAVAVLDSHAEVRHVAAICELSVEEVGLAADALEEANVLDGGRPLRFVHPIARQAVYGELRSGSRSRLHARAADVLMAAGERPERAAAHLLLSEPAGDVRRVDVLRQAAAAALSRGAAELAQRFLERALAEPPAPDAIADVRCELGMAEALAGRDLSVASEHLERAAVGTADPRVHCERVRLAARARLHMADFAGAAGLLAGERAALGEGERAQALRLLADEAAIGVLVPPVARAALAELEAHSGVSGEDPGELAVLAEIAGKRWLEGRIGEAAEFSLRALDGGRLLGAEGPMSVAFNHAVAVLIDGDRFEEAAGPLDAALALAREQGSLLGVATLTGLRAVMAWRQGMLLETESFSREMLQLVKDSGSSAFDPHYWAYLGAVLVERSELEQAEEAIANTRVGAGLPNGTHGGMPFVARARLRLAQGRPDGALSDLLELRSRERALGVRHMRFAWRYDAVKAALALDDQTLAGELADEQLELTTRWDTPSARGIALCSKGLASAGAERIELLGRGAALLSQSPARLDHARVLADLGAALRREGRRAQARQPLTAAIEHARALGATALVERTRAELLAAGARPRRPRFTGAESLTAAEWRVAGLAVQGRSNREIAGALFVTVRTVENHLASCYRKLGIGSRRELAGALESGPSSGTGRRFSVLERSL